MTQKEVLDELTSRTFNCQHDSTYGIKPCAEMRTIYNKEMKVEHWCDVCLFCKLNGLVAGPRLP